MKRLSVLGQFMATVERYDLLPQGSRVLVAVSGGADSVCLLLLLRAVASRRGLTLFGFHMNHGLRKAARRDEEFVRSLFTEAGIELKVVRSDVPGYVRRHRVGIEEAGRELRYRNLARVARRFDCDRTALGHTADDNLETMLLNLARGTGPHGLVGIPVRRGGIVRPMIDLEREQVVRYLRACRAGWVEDETNRDPAFRRNLIRGQALAALREVNPAVVGNARRTARLLQDEDEFLDMLATRALDAVVVRRGIRILIDTCAFDAYNTSLKRRMVKRLVPELDAEGIERVVEFSRGGPDRLRLTKTVELYRRRGFLELR